MLVWGAFAQEQAGRAKYELIRETINFLATDKSVSKDTAFRISCEAPDYTCFGQQLASEPIAGIGPWYDRWRAMAAADEKDLAKLRNRIFTDIFERPGKGYRKKLAAYEAYVARTASLIAPPAPATVPEAVAADEGIAEDTLLEGVADNAGLHAIYPDPATDQIDNPENETPMIAYLAFAIGLIALALVALPMIRKKEQQPSLDSDGLEELHSRLDGIASRMKSLEQKTTDAHAAEAMIHLTDIMESVEKRVVELENRIKKNL